MTGKRRRSSRKRMKARLRGSPKQRPTIATFNEKGHVTNPFFNHAMRKHQAAYVRHAPGRTVREEARNYRKLLQKRARRAIARIRKELKQALRGRA